METRFDLAMAESISLSTQVGRELLTWMPASISELNCQGVEETVSF